MDRLNRDSGNGMVNKGILLNNMKYLAMLNDILKLEKLQWLELPN